MAAAEPRTDAAAGAGVLPDDRLVSAVELVALLDLQREHEMQARCIDGAIGEDGADFPTCSRMRRTAAASVTKARIRMAPPQRWQTKSSTS